jgi:hypothetical protein
MINRDNYEAFFLMYVDNELSTIDKKMVEAFVLLHPDLQEELAMLQQTVILPEDNIIFTHKNLLFRHTESADTPTINEEQLLLYIDNELAIQDKAALEIALVSHTTLQKDLKLLQQTKLPREAIVCPNKESLYKEEKKRVAYMRWQYMAAAALIGLVATVYFTMTNSKISNATMANLNRSSKSTTPTILSNTTTLAETPVLVMPNKHIATTTLVSNHNNISNKKMPVTEAVTQQTAAASNTAKSFKDGAQDFLTSPLKNIENNIASTVTNPAINRNNNSTAKNNPSDVSLPSLPVITNALNTTNTASQQVVYKELDTNSDDKSLLVGAVEINKDKLRGFLRKASKLFGNKQKNDDDAKSSLISNK